MQGQDFMEQPRQYPFP